jgi:hypothetical protein
MFGYMLIATDPLFSRFTFINDHPALPDGPTGTYQEVILELMRSGSRESGCMMNLVTGDVDRGPAVSFCRYPLFDQQSEPLWRSYRAAVSEGEPFDEQDAPLFHEIRGRGVARERPFLVETLAAIAAGTLGVPPLAPLDLTDAVDALVNSGTIAGR